MTRESTPNGLDKFSIVILNKAPDTIWLIADISGKLEGLQIIRLGRGRKSVRKQISPWTLLKLATGLQAVVVLVLWAPGSPFWRLIWSQKQWCVYPIWESILAMRSISKQEFIERRKRKLEIKFKMNSLKAEQTILCDLTKILCQSSLVTFTFKFLC